MHGQVYWYRNKASGHAGISRFKSDWVLMGQEIVSRELLCTTRLFALWIAPVVSMEQRVNTTSTQPVVAP